MKVHDLLQYPYDSLSLGVALALSVLVAYTVLSLWAHLMLPGKRLKTVWVVGGTIAVGTALSLIQWLEVKALLLPATEAYPLEPFAAGVATISAGVASSLIMVLRHRKWTTAAAWLYGAFALSHFQFLQTMLMQPAASFSSDGIALYLALILGLFYAVWKTLSVGPGAASSFLHRVGRVTSMGLLVFLTPFTTPQSLRLAADAMSQQNSGHTIHLSRIEFFELIAFSFVLLLFALVATAMDHHACQQAEALATIEVQRRMTASIHEQRVTRLQNEALMEEIGERQKAESRLRHIAFHDPVTQLKNRTHFMEMLKMARQRVKDDARHTSGVIYVDLDNFKSVNDMFGHWLIQLPARNI